MKKTITISTYELKEVLRNSLTEAFRFPWTGWRIPIYMDIEIESEAEGIATATATFSKGSWMSNSSWKPGAVEICAVERWGESEDDLSNYIDEEVDLLFEEVVGEVENVVCENNKCENMYKEDDDMEWDEIEWVD